MRINPIISNYQTASVNRKSNFQNKNVQPSFNGKNQCAKAFGVIAGGLGSIGAVGGLLIMTGGVALPLVALYGGVCAAAGAIVGHQVDKDAEKTENENQTNKKN